MAVVDRQRIALAAGEKLTTLAIAINPETAALILRIERPTSAQARDWPDSCRIRASIIVVADGDEYRCSVEDVGGIKSMPARGEMPAHEVAAFFLSYELPSGFFGRKSGFPERLGVGKGTFTVQVEIGCLSGVIDTAMELISIIAQRERVAYDKFQNSLRGQ